MRNLLYVLFVGAIVLPCGSATIAQESAETISVAAPRPIDGAIRELTRRYGWVISYEDPPYEFGGDIEDVTRATRKEATQPLEIGSVSAIKDPRREAISVSFDTVVDRRNKIIEDQVIGKILDTYRENFGTTFVLREDKDGRRIVVPDTARDSSGTLKPAKRLLDTKLNAPTAEENGEEVLQALCRELTRSTGVKVILASYPANALRHPVKDLDYSGLSSAREILEGLFASFPDGDRYSWAFLYQPGYGYGLNIAFHPESRDAGVSNGDVEGGNSVPQHKKDARSLPQ